MISTFLKVMNKAPKFPKYGGNCLYMFRAYQHNVTSLNVNKLAIKYTVT